MKAFLKTKVFWKLKNANENETEILNSNNSYRTEQSTFQNDNAKAAFTLAEVLITLGIIGIVAAMTIPTLIQNYRKQVVETRLSKFYSVMNQAIKMASVEYGPPETWSDYWFGGPFYDKDGNLISTQENSDAVFQKYFAPYVKIIKKKKINSYNYYYLPDGGAFRFAYSQNSDIAFFPDNVEKCIKLKQQTGICLFSFRFNAVSTANNNTLHYKKGMEPFLAEWDKDEETLYTNTSYGCKSGNGNYCTAIIQHNGWKIPKNYPRKL